MGHLRESRLRARVYGLLLLMAVVITGLWTLLLCQAIARIFRA